MDWNIDRNPATPTARPGTYYSDYTALVATLLIVLSVVFVAMPVALFGVVIAWAVWRLLPVPARPTILTLCAFAVSGVVTILICNRLVAWFWPWGTFAPDRLWHMLPAVSATPLSASTVLWTSAGIELCAGPFLLIVVDLLLKLQDHTLSGGLFRQSQRQERSRLRTHDPLQQQTAQYPGGMAPPATAMRTADPGHPLGGIRLGVEKDNRRRPFDIPMKELALHTFLPGVTGSGKTTTLERLADGAMDNGSGLVIIDCKGGSLGVTARKLAARHRLPFIVVDPHDAATVGYEPCTGSPSDVANKIIGSFSFGEGGEIYKQIAMHVVPLVVRGLVATGTPVSLRSIASSCDLNGLRVLARKVEGDGSNAELVELADELSNLLDESDTAGKNGVLSLKHRFGAIVQGEFGPLFRRDVVP